MGVFTISILGRRQAVRHRTLTPGSRGSESRRPNQKYSSLFGELYFYFGEDEDTPGPYLTSQKCKPQAQNFWLTEAIQRAKRFGNPAAPTKKVLSIFVERAFLFYKFQFYRTVLLYLN